MLNVSIYSKEMISPHFPTQLYKTLLVSKERAMMTDSLGKMDQEVMEIEEEEDDSFDKFDDAHSQWQVRTKL